MTWLKLDDGFMRHPKVMHAGKDARDLYLAGALYCAANLTDGHIPAAALSMLAAEAIVDDAGTAASRLLDAGLWELDSGGYRVHDFLVYNPSREDVIETRDARSQRKQLYADPFLIHRIKARDQSQCRYCGRAVRWNDRKGDLGGTYDHVVPDGGNSADNLVVACRACNSRKGRRTPEQARMSLLPAPSSTNGSESDLDPIQKLSAYPGPVPVPVPVPDQPVTNPPVSTAAGGSGGKPAPRAAAAIGPFVEILASQRGYDLGERDLALIASTYGRLDLESEALAIASWMKTRPKQACSARLVLNWLERSARTSRGGEKGDGEHGADRHNPGGPASTGRITGDPGAFAGIDRG